MEQKVNILIVDDIPENLEILSNVLISEGYNVTFAENGKEALNISDKKDYDLILLDIMMPEMDGFEVCKILKNKSKTKEIPIIFLTARTETEDIVNGFEIGAVDYISKPFSSAELLSRVNTHIDLKKSKDLIKQQNKLLLEEIEERKKAQELIAKQKKELENKNQNITSSIFYAQVIQNAVLPSDSYLKHYMPESFIINIPKDIVSGDFYWIKQIDDLILVAAADCTGHGVPGAFMSMLGIAFLTEIVINADWKSDYNAANVLDELRNRVKLALHQDRRKDAVSDGMDLALCIFNLTSKKMNFAGANNPAYIIRNNKNNEKELLILDADKQPISIHLQEKPFDNKEIQLLTNDIIYIFSDGFIDQFGGALGQKYLRKNFKNILLEISDFKLDKQKDLLLKSFYNWKGKKEQVDDVLIIGMKIEENYGDVDLFFGE